MQDPFADNSNNRLQREVQVWMAGLACLLVAFLYLAVKRMAGPNEEFPAHVLQSGVAHVTAPIGHSPNFPPPLNPPALTSAPAIPKAGFSAKSTSNPVSKQRPHPSFSFPSHRKPAGTLISAPKPIVPKQKAVAQLEPNKQFSLPQPKFVAVPELKNTAAANDADAEALGRRRARQLAAITSGLPKRLNKIQSTIKQASAELPVEIAATGEALPEEEAKLKKEASPKEAVPKGNSFVPVTSFPAQPVPVNPTTVKSDDTQPHVESSHPIKPFIAEPFSIKPNRQLEPKADAQPSVRPSAIVSPTKNEPAKLTPAPNSFRPMSMATATKADSPSPVIKPLPADKEISSPVAKIPQPLRAAVSATPLKGTIDRSEPASTSKQHIVEAGDSFFTIAQQHYGDGQWFRALRLANQSLIENHDGLQAGMSLSIPTTEELARQFPDQAFRSAAQQPSEAQRRIYETQAGDTLFDIARRKTGQGARFSEIIEANKFLLPAGIRASDKLPADLRLVLPESTLQ